MYLRSNDWCRGIAGLPHYSEFIAKLCLSIVLFFAVGVRSQVTKAANRAFAEQAPAELLGYLQKHKASLIPEFHEAWRATGFKSSGTWEEIFGRGLPTDEIFMAWHFAKYVNAVTQAGKKEHPLPMFVNAALIRPGYKPGQYPSAGPLPHLMDVWRAGAPHIDFFAPDIYFKSFSEWCEKYDQAGNPLFIPEVANNQSVANAYYAMARHNAMGYSPFSIESLENPETNQISKGYEVLQQLAPLILAHQGRHMHLPGDSFNMQKVKLYKYE